MIRKEEEENRGEVGEVEEKVIDMTESLFRYLALRFSNSLENLATEALSFILN